MSGVAGGLRFVEELLFPGGGSGGFLYLPEPGEDFGFAHEGEEWGVDWMVQANG